MTMIKIPISVGELLDKITILQLKSEKTNNQFVHKELKELVKISKELHVYNEDYLIKLKEVNTTLWSIEDRMRILEDQQIFNEEFIKLARSVYINNDMRALIKKEINSFYNSEYQEVKIFNK